eukprot:3959372-Amphidinium_carterae.2
MSQSLNDPSSHITKLPACLASQKGGSLLVLVVAGLDNMKGIPTSSTRLTATWCGDTTASFGNLTRQQDT